MISFLSNYFSNYNLLNKAVQFSFVNPSVRIIKKLHNSFKSILNFISVINRYSSYCYSNFSKKFFSALFSNLNLICRRSFRNLIVRIFLNLKILFNFSMLISYPLKKSTKALINSGFTTNESNLIQ